MSDKEFSLYEEEEKIINRANEFIDPSNESNLEEVRIQFSQLLGNYKKLSHNILKYNANRKKLFIRNKINDAYKETKRFNYKVNCKKYLKLIKKYL